MVNHSKKVLAILLSIIILSFIPISVSAASVELIIAPIFPTLYNSAGSNVETLDDYVDIDEFRAYLINGLASCPESLDISRFNIKYTSATFTAICYYMYYETPELFHILNSGGTLSGNYIKTLTPSYRYSANEYSSMLSEFYEGADTLLKGIKGNNNLSDVEKALLLHDRLALWCEYDYARLLDGTMPDESYTAYGVFAKKTAVCMGYALAYDYLLLQVGIDSYYCSSKAINHAWNIVYINNTKYHVDVTWDDPVWDRSGQVYHDNFLRSTTGIIETGHVKNNSIDYDSTPSDTTYDSYYWQNSTAAFQLVDNDIYYIDNSAETLNKISNGVTTICKSINETWLYSSNSYWPGNYACLAFDGQSLLISLTKAVYKYDTKAGTLTEIFKPTLAQSYYSIFGFKFEDCKLICEVLNTPNYDENTKKNYTQTQTHHVESDWVVVKAPSPDSTGIKQKSCINCNLMLEEFTIPAISITAKENTSIDYTNSLVFTDVLACQSIDDLLTAYGTTTASIESPNSFYGTGTIITISVDGEAVHTFTLIVNGDIDGDSVCDAIDLALAARYSTSKQLPSEYEIYAANCGIGDNITQETYQNLVNRALSL